MAGNQINLEEQLRSMILSNAPPDNPDRQHISTHTPSATQPQTVRGQSNSPRFRGQHQPGRSFQQPHPFRSYHQGRSSLSQSSLDFPAIQQAPIAPSQSIPQPRRGDSPRYMNESHHPPRLLSRQQPPRGVHNGSSEAPGSPPVQQRFHQPSLYQSQSYNEAFTAQCRYLEDVAKIEIPRVEISETERLEKESFRKRLEELCNAALSDEHDGAIAKLELRCFGSISSGFAIKGSDMDLAIVPTWRDSSRPSSASMEQAIPRLIEKKLLEHGYGARLLTRTRVPIIKVCESPTPELYRALRAERRKWDRIGYDGGPIDAKAPPEPKPIAIRTLAEPHVSPFPGEPAPDFGSQKPTEATSMSSAHETKDVDWWAGLDDANKRRTSKPWLREKALGPLDFPKVGVGIQSDINFSNSLALHNTALLRCYSLCDPRVQPMVLFVKAWAKRRKINSSYSGTLSSYGYVLMVLHYLINVASPPVLPNLQLLRLAKDGTTTEPLGNAESLTVEGWTVNFWRDENAIKQAAREHRLTQNRDPLPVLLRGFFQYFAVTGLNFPSNYSGFSWTQDVLSLRTPWGIRSKSSKGWTGAKTVTKDGKEVRNRYLFAIEDPFELDHNVARTVTHPGIVAIRDEFRRAWRILLSIGRHSTPEGGLFDPVEESVLPVSPYDQL